MSREVTVLCLLQEIKYLKQELLNTPRLHYIGLCQWVSTRPLCPQGKYSFSEYINKPNIY